MALALQPVVVTFSFRDRGNKNYSCSFYLGEGTPGGLVPSASSAPIKAYLDEFYASLRNSSDLAGVGWSLTQKYAEEPNLTDWVGMPNGAEKGVLVFDAGNTPNLFTIPGLKDAALASDNRHIARNGSVFIPGVTGDIAVHLQSIHDKLQNGATDGVVNYPAVDNEGNDYNGLLDAYLQTRATSRP